MAQIGESEEGVQEWEGMRRGEKSVRKDGKGMSDLWCGRWMGKTEKGRDVQPE